MKYVINFETNDKISKVILLMVQFIIIFCVKLTEC
jgi:hypothetical protein